jgi:hypothetical protein
MAELRINDVSQPRSSLLLLESRRDRAAALIDAAQQVVPDGARLVTGQRGQPPLLTEARLSALAAAFRGSASGALLPPSISGLHKADLLLGNDDGSRWVGVSVKSGNARPSVDSGVPLAIRVRDDVNHHRIERLPSGLVVVTLGDASPLMTRRRDAYAAMQRAFYKLTGTGHLNRAGKTVEELADFLIDNQYEQAQVLASQLWTAAGLQTFGHSGIVYAGSSGVLTV